MSARISTGGGTMRRFATCLTVAILHLSAACALGQTRVATFESYPDCLFLPNPFIDSESGIRFSNPLPAGNSFRIEQGPANPVWPTFLPTTYLTGGGCVIGGGITSSGNFGFDGLLPTDASRVSMAVGFYNAAPGTGRLSLDGFDASGLLVAHSLRDPLQVGSAETSITITSPVPNIHSFSIRATDLSTSYYNIQFAVPEPSTLLTLAISLMTLRRQRRNPCRRIVQMRK